MDSSLDRTGQFSGQKNWTAWSCLKCKRCEGDREGEEKVHLKTHTAMLVGVGKNGLAQGSVTKMKI